MRKLVAAAMLLLTGCSAAIRTDKIASSEADQTATGLRYFRPERVEIRVYHVFLPESLPVGAEMKHRVDRIGDAQVDTINDTSSLWQVTYQGALFSSQNVKLGLNDKGAVKEIGLQSTGGASAVGALQAIQKGTETARDLPKTVEQARIDELNRRTNLIKARQDLEKALAGTQ
jgi:hypothetical protein